MRTPAAVCCLVFLAYCEWTLAAEKPNILFIAVDDLRPELTCFGADSMVTPNLDKLAEEGTLFKRFYVTGNWCNPSRAGFLTSRHHATMPNWADNYGYGWRQTVTELFKKAGYATGQIGKWHLGPTDKITDHGFDDVYAKNSNRPGWANYSDPRRKT